MIKFVLKNNVDKFLRVCSSSVANIKCPNFFHWNCGNIHSPVPGSPIKWLKPLQGDRTTAVIKETTGFLAISVALFKFECIEYSVAQIIDYFREFFSFFFICIFFLLKIN